MRQRLLVPAVLLLGCSHAAPIVQPPVVQSPPVVAPPGVPEGDLHTHVATGGRRVRHLNLDLTLDFQARRAQGAVELDLVTPGAAPIAGQGGTLVLDSQGLVIEGVTGADGKPRPWILGPEDPRIGSALTITLEPGDAKVRVAYHTTEKSAALQWLAPEQTRDRTQPFLFTQGEAIFTRTWIPLQDSPEIRTTYDATIRAPRPLTVVMSAEQLGRGADGAWRFHMPQAIPSYLIALAAGDLAFAPISKRSGVWAEPSLVKAARDELSDTESMIQAAEALFRPYRWGRYDVLVLPPSFPFGGMENPRLTFATPTVLAGDKSLVSLVAHELAHSWSGNLVTNGTWRDFWLNEGFTVYCEQRIMERVFGLERTTMERQLGRQDLEKEMRELEPWQQVLHPDLRGRHPDDYFSSVPYVKGALFLRRLEAIFGRERFDQVLRGWFDGHAFQSAVTDDFVQYLKRELLDREPQKAAQINLDLWLNQPGLPGDAPRDDSAAMAKVDAQRDRFVQGAVAASLETKGWVTQQWQRFIQGLPDTVALPRLAELDSAFGFTASHNSEILCDWLVVAIRRHYTTADSRVSQFLMEVGRRKYLKPLYTELAKTPEGLERARSIYAKARPRYHAVSAGTIDKILKWNT
jgi:leukotriene-A4 hydrolase